MRRVVTIALAAFLLLVLGVAASGCGGGEETTATPDTVTGTLPTETEPTDTEPTETEPTEPETPEGDPVAGRDVFSAQCAACHTLADAGTTGTIGPNLDDSQPSFEAVAEIVTDGRGAMPPFGGTLTEQQIADVSAYVAEAAGG